MLAVSDKKSYTRFMLIVISLVTIFFIGVIALNGWFSYQRNIDDLNRKFDYLSLTYSPLLATSIAHNNKDELRIYVSSLLTNLEIVQLQVEDDKAKILEKYVNEDSKDSLMVREVLLKYIDGDVVKEVGKLLIYFSPSEISHYFIEQFKQQLLLLLSLIILVLLATKIVYKSVIENPLDELIQYLEDETKEIDKEIDFEQHEIETNANELIWVHKQFKYLKSKQALLLQKLNNESFKLNTELENHTKTKEKLQEKERCAEATLNSISDSIVIVDNQGVIEFINNSAKEMISSDDEKIIDRNLFDIISLYSIESKEPVFDLVNWCLELPKTHCPSVELFLKTVAGKEYTVEFLLSALHNDNEKKIGVVILIRDITQSKEQSNKLSYLAQHDTLTGLINRREFISRMQSLMDNARIFNQRHVLFYLDLDDFKIINDECGHASGDKVLRQVSVEFKKQLRRNDCIGRIGGDEFGIMLQDCDIEAAQVIAEKIRHDIESFHFSCKNKSYNLGVSIGVVAITGNEGSTENLLNLADSCCYRAKQNGRNQVHL